MTSPFGLSGIVSQPVWSGISSPSGNFSTVLLSQPVWLTPSVPDGGFGDIEVGYGEGGYGEGGYDTPSTFIQPVSQPIWNVVTSK